MIGAQRPALLVTDDTDPLRPFGIGDCDGRRTLPNAALMLPRPGSGTFQDGSVCEPEAVCESRVLRRRESGTVFDEGN